jgi:hypothetical protein
MKITTPIEDLRLLKRSISGSGVFGILLLIYPVFTHEESKICSIVGSTLMVFAAIHLSYLRRLEKKLNAAINK